jgi:hypothetical protein
VQQEKHACKGQHQASGGGDPGPQAQEGFFRQQFIQSSAQQGRASYQPHSPPQGNGKEGEGQTHQKGFRSLYEDASPNEKLPLRFYINGIGEDLTSSIDDVQHSMFDVRRPTSDVHDLQGRRVTTPKKGLYIINGKKVFIK